MVKIIVSQEEYIKFGKSFDALERNYYHFLGDHEIIPVPNIIKVPDYDYDCLLLTGGPDSPARHKTENLLFAHAFKKQVPIIGICMVLYCRLRKEKEWDTWVDVDTM